jgi:lipid-A-disaccharide synthase
MNPDLNSLNKTPRPPPTPPASGRGDRVFFLIAGEASGDVLGARLMQALKAKLNGAVCFAGIGGERMIAEGLQPLFPQSELAHFGVFEVLRHIPHLLKRINETAEEVKRIHPAALITIDSPDFCFRVAKRVKGQGFPLIHYVAPTVWAWRAGRAKKIAQFLDHLLALLPFEPPYFTKEGLGCSFVGHPIVENGADQGNAERFRRKYHVTDATPLLALLPGSRRGEVRRLMPVFAATVAKLKQRFANLTIVIPAAPGFAERLKQETASWGVPVLITEGDAEKYDALTAAQAALACSGTVALELALASLPAVIAYKLNPLTYFMVRRLVKVRFANLVNIMHDRLVVPELLQENCTPDRLVAAIDPLLRDEAERQKQIAGLNEVAAWLGRDQFVPSVRAAESVLKVVEQRHVLDA